MTLCSKINSAVLAIGAIVGSLVAFEKAVVSIENNIDPSPLKLSTVLFMKTEDLECRRNVASQKNLAQSYGRLKFLLVKEC